LDDETDDNQVELFQLFLFTENGSETDGQCSVKNCPYRTNNPARWLKERFVFRIKRQLIRLTKGKQSLIEVRIDIDWDEFVVVLIDRNLEWVEDEADACFFKPVKRNEFCFELGA